MKTIYIISVLISFMGLFAMGQTPTIQTPWGTTVDVWTQEDDDPEERYNNDQRYIIPYVNPGGANFLPTLPGDNNYQPSSSLTFDCHGYAWYMYWRESDPFGDPWHISPTEVANYWNDPSFVECTAAEADILWISNGAHSALTTTDTTKLLSKWGDGPLAVHGKAIGQSPWPVTSSTTVTYYKKCLEEFTGTIYSDLDEDHCGTRFNDVTVSNFVEIDIEYEEGVVIEGTFITGIGVTLNIYPD